MSGGQELKDLSEPTSFAAGTYSEISGRRYSQKDERILAHLGKKQVLKVSFER